MNKFVGFVKHHYNKLSISAVMAAMMVCSAFAAEGDFNMATTMGTATDGIVTSLQGIAGVVIPKAIPVLGIIIALRFGKYLIKSATGGR